MNKKLIDEIHMFFEKNNAKIYDTIELTSTEMKFIFDFNDGDERMHFRLTRSKDAKGYFFYIIPLGNIRGVANYKQNDKKQLSWFIQKFETWLRKESFEKLRIEVKKSTIDCDFEMYQFLPKEEQRKRSLELPIEILDLSIRPYNCLRKEGVKKIKDVISYTKTDIYNIEQMGEKSALQIFEQMKNLGFELKEG